jgi:hypothetical protein
MQIASIGGERNPHIRTIPREHDPYRHDGNDDNAHEQ